jgi:hypothetical protein
LEHVVVVDAENPAEALKGAVSISRSFFGQPERFKELGYSAAPSLYAIVSMHSADDVSVSASRPHEYPLITKFSFLDERDVEQLKSFEKVPTPVWAFYIEE